MSINAFCWYTERVRINHFIRLVYAIYIMVYKEKQKSKRKNNSIKNDKKFKTKKLKKICFFK